MLYVRYEAEDCFRVPREVVTIERRQIEAGTACISYQVAGVGKPVILVHGLSGSGRWWAKNITPLAQQFRTYAVDLIRFGGSRGLQEFVLDEAARSITRWMDQLGIARASIIGHSMGGFIAADLAADFPDRVERLVLVDAAVLPFNRVLWQHALGLVQALWRLPLSFLSVLVTDAYRSGPVTIWNAARQLLTADIRPKLAQIQVPTLLVWGEHDALVPLELAEQIRGYVPHAELTVVRSAGHNPMWDRPDEFNRLVADFLRTP